MKDDGQGEMGGTPWEPSKGAGHITICDSVRNGPGISHFKCVLSVLACLGTEGGHCEQMFCFGAILFCVL